MQSAESEFFEAASVSEMVEGQNTLKASLFTLIVLAQDIDRTHYCQQLVYLIAKKFPCKIIFISLDTTAQQGLFETTRMTRSVSGPGSICCDMLRVKLSMDQVAKIPFLVVSELISDLPAFLLVGHNPFEIESVIHMLEPYVGRIVFDAMHLGNVGAFAQQMLAAKTRDKYVDLNWARTKPWRESLSRVFQSEERFAHLAFCGHLEIRYSRRAGKDHSADTQAVFLQAWFASRLGWTLINIEQTEEQTKILYRYDHHEIVVLLSPIDSDIMEEGNICAVELRGQHDVHYLLNYEVDDRHIVVHSSSQDRCEMPYTLFVGSFQRGRTLPAEIFQQAISEHYLPMIELLSHSGWMFDRYLLH